MVCTESTLFPKKENKNMPINSKLIEKAENIIKKYIHDNYGWEESVYEISLESKNQEDNFINFFVGHEDDIKSGIRGHGKSLLLKFDMGEMKVVEELPSQ
jgi:hypothetical protein